MKMRRLSKALGLTALVVTAFCATAGAAQANVWLLQHTAMPSATSFNQGGTLTIKMKARNMELRCNVGGSGTATPSSALSGSLSLSGCIPYAYESSTTIPCTAKWLNNGTLEGTAESATLSTMNLELTGAECPLPKNSELKGVTLSLSYGPQAKELAVTGTATGTLLGTSAALAGAFNWRLSGTNSTKSWGYGEPMFVTGKWYANGALLEGTTTFSREGTMVLETPSSGRVITCGETTVGELGPSGLLSTESTLATCKLKGFETKCTIPSIPYTNKSESILIKASGAECPLAKEQKYIVPSFSYAFGPESVNLANFAWGTAAEGGNPTYWESSTTWKLTGARSGQTLGFH